MRGIESVWSDIRCTRTVDVGEVLGKEEMRVLRYDWICFARWVFPDVG